MVFFPLCCAGWAWAVSSPLYLLIIRNAHWSSLAYVCLSGPISLTLFLSRRCFTGPLFALLPSFLLPSPIPPFVLPFFLIVSASTLLSPVAYSWIGSFLSDHLGGRKEGKGREGGRQGWREVKGEDMEEKG